MLDIVVRSKKDADAVRAMLRAFYRGWDVRVYTLHGARSADRALAELEAIVEGDRFYVVMLGREDRDVARELDRVLPPNIAVHVVPRARVRNARLAHLAAEFDAARSLFRLAVGWDGAYLFGLRRGAPLEGFEPNPAYDVFLGIGEGFRRRLAEVLGGDPGLNPLLVRKFAGAHDVYSGPRRIAELAVPCRGRPRGRVLGGDRVDVPLEKLLKANEEVLRLYEGSALALLSRYRGWADRVIVRWSGGKDSTAALILALKAFPRGKVVAMFSDTGVEFPETLRYVEEVAEKLGVEVYRFYAGVDRGILEEGMPMPTHENRWCTARKIATVDEGLKQLASGNTLIVVGDRDAESRQRGLRPFAREEGGAVVVSPIKLWGTAMVQLYLYRCGVKPNPLYERGFYRIGCYICPALRSWELHVMLRDEELRRELEGKPLFKRFLYLAR